MEASHAASSSSPEAQSLQNSAPSNERKTSKGAKTGDKIRRRNRTINSCLECRRRKLKCDKTFPCGSCTKFGRECKYLQGGTENPEAAREIAHLKEQLAGLEKSFEERVAGASKDRSRSMTSPSIPGMDDDDSSDDAADPFDDEKDLEPTPLAVMDAAYYDDADDDLMDLGVRFGKFRVTERIGGFVRPKLLEELKHYIMETPSTEGPEDPTSPEAIAENRILTEEDYLGPSTQYVAPSSNFVFGGESASITLDHYLFEKPASDRLIEQYFESVHYMCRVVHRPSFERQYERFWRNRYVTTGAAVPPPSFVAVMMAAMLSAVVSMSEAQVNEFAPGQTQANLIDHFRRGTEFALSRANFLRTTKLETLQAFTMYLIPLCRAEVSRAHSALTGTAIRLAECMSLHRDGSHYSLSPVEIHVRRMVWHQLCFLDLRTCEATGPRPQIRAEDFDTKFPLNVDDKDLESSHPPIEDAERWTDMTFSRMRFECNEMHRLIWHERPRVEAKKSTLTALLGKVKHFWDATEKKYLPMINDKIPLQFMALLTYRALNYKMNIMILHRYSSNADRIMPERLRQILLSSGLAQLEHAIAVETQEKTRPWAWYSGAFQQYHTALLILGEIYSAPNHYQHRDRVWMCIDYVFELPGGMNPGHKSRIILSELKRRMEMYQRHRKIRAPTVMEGRAGPRPVPSILEQKNAEKHGRILPGGYVLTGSSDLGATPPEQSYRTSSRSPSAPAAPPSDVQFGSAANHIGAASIASASPPAAGPQMSTEATGGMTNDGMFTFAPPPWHQPRQHSIATTNPMYGPSPGAQSDSSGAVSVGTVAANATLNMDLSGLAEAAVGAGQAAGVGSGGWKTDTRAEGLDNMEIDWDEMNRLFPASEWETGEFPLSNMGFDFGNAYQGVPGSMRFS